MLLHQALAHMEPYRPQRPMREVQAELGLERIVKLSSNEGAFGPLLAAVAAYEAAAAELNRYPDGGGLRLRGELAARHGVRLEQVVLGNGADELIRLCAVASLAPGDRGVLPWPSFPSYATSIACCAGEAVQVRLDGRRVDLDALLAAVAAGGARTKLVYLANPNNPTGALLDRTELREFLELLPDGVLCVLDEAYAEYADDEPEGIALVRERPVRPRPTVGGTMTELPLACSLDATGLAAQRARYGVVARHVLTLARGERTLKARLDEALDGVVLRELIEVERDCCPFFAIDFDAGERLLTVSVADAEHEPALAAIAHSLARD